MQVVPHSEERRPEEEAKCEDNIVKTTKISACKNAEDILILNPNHAIEKPPTSQFLEAESKSSAKSVINQLIPENRNLSKAFSNLTNQRKAVKRIIDFYCCYQTRGPNLHHHRTSQS